MSRRDLPEECGYCTTVCNRWSRKGAGCAFSIVRPRQRLEEAAERAGLAPATKRLRSVLCGPLRMTWPMPEITRQSSVRGTPRT